MPGVTLHLHLAERALRRWHRRGGAPFPAGDPTVAQAFRLGSFGPDLGYFPGGPTALSDLAHAHRTADLCRALLAAARGPLQTAFAWGWVGHVLADTAVHPLIGCAVGELVHGSASRFVAGDSDPEAHGRVEAGLDAVYARRYPALRRTPPAALEGPALGFVAAAYRKVYGLVLEPESLLRAHRVAARRAAQGLMLAGFTSRLADGAETVRTGQGEGPLRRRVARSALAFAYLFPVRPPCWLVTAVRAAARAFPRLLDATVRSEGVHLDNRNLDTGELESRASGHGAAVRARLHLELAGLRPTSGSQAA
jgi:hypothetical protein